MVIWAPFDPLEFDTHHELENEHIVKSMEVIAKDSLFLNSLHQMRIAYILYSSPR